MSPAPGTGASDPSSPPPPGDAGPRIGVHLGLKRGLRRAAERAGEIGAQSAQVFVDNPTAWRRRTAPPRHLDDFRRRLAELEVRPLAVHAAYLVNLAGPEPAFRASSIDVLAADMVAGRGYGASIVNVHTGSHRDTSLEEGIDRVARAVAEVLARASVAWAGPPAPGPEPVLALENAAGGGWAVGSSIDELAAIAERAATLGVPDARLGFCLDTAHAWGAGIGMDDPDSIDAWLEAFDRALGLGRLVMVHLNDSRSERGSRTDRHEHVGAGRIGPRGLGHLLRHPLLRDRPFVLETPGMDDGYDLVNLERCRALLAGLPLDPLPEAAFKVSRRSSASAPADDDVELPNRAARSQRLARPDRPAGPKRPRRSAGS